VLNMKFIEEKYRYYLILCQNDNVEQENVLSFEEYKERITELIEAKGMSRKYFLF